MTYKEKSYNIIMNNKVIPYAHHRLEDNDMVNNPGYWTADIQFSLREEILHYLKTHKITRLELAQKLGYTRAYVGQLINGDVEYKLSKLVEMSLAIGKVPVVIFMDKREDKTSITPDEIRHRKYVTGVHRVYTIENITKECIKAFSEDTGEHYFVDDIRARTRKRRIIEIRQCAAYISCYKSKLPLTVIGEFFGGLDHSTICYARDTWGKLIEYNKRLNRITQSVLDNLKKDAEN